MGSRTATPATRRKNQAPRSLSFWRAGERPPGVASSATRVPMARFAAARSERLVHLRQDRFVVLQVAVDHRDQFGARRQPALDDRAREADAIDAPDAARARIARRQGIGDVGGAVGRIVVDDDHFPGQARERRLEPFEKDGNVGRFAIGRHDHGEGRPRLWHRRIRIHFALIRRARRFPRGDVSADTARERRASSHAREPARSGFRRARRGPTRAIAADRSPRNRGRNFASVSIADGSGGTTMTPSRPTKRALSSRNAMPRGSSEKTKTGVPGPSASAILPPSVHFVATTKAARVP